MDRKNHPPSIRHPPGHVTAARDGGDRVGQSPIMGRLSKLQQPACHLAENPVTDQLADEHAADLLAEFASDRWPQYGA